MPENKPIVIGQSIDSAKLELAKELRRSMTPAEKTLWEVVRRNQVDGLHFRRQQIVGGFIVDFYCHRARLAIELDGDVHERQVDYDQARDTALSHLNVAVVRFSNDEILDELECVIKQLQQLCTPKPPSQ